MEKVVTILAFWNGMFCAATITACGNFSLFSCMEDQESKDTRVMPIGITYKSVQRLLIRCRCLVIYIYNFILSVNKNVCPPVTQEPSVLWQI